MKTGGALWGVMLLAAFLSCGRAKPGFCPPATPVSGILASIDSLMGWQPDSALAVMMEFTATPEADSLDVFNSHYCQLLISELLYKNDCEQTNRTELLRAAEYFDSIAFTPSETPVFLSARVHYMKGVGYYERDSVTEACREYLQALEIMEGRFEEKDLVGKKARFMALTYNRLIELFSSQFMMEPAIECGKRALQISKTFPISHYSVSLINYKLGIQHDKLKQYNRAFYYYRQALKGLPDTNSLFYRDIASSIAILDYQMQKKAMLFLIQ